MFQHLCLVSKRRRHAIAGLLAAAKYQPFKYPFQDLEKGVKDIKHFDSSILNLQD